MIRNILCVAAMALMAWGLAPVASALASVLGDPPPVPASAGCETTLQKQGAGFSWDVRACSGTCLPSGGGGDCDEIAAGDGMDPYPRYRYCACDESWNDAPKCCTITACKNSSLGAWLPAAIGDCRNTPNATWGCPDPGEDCDDVPIGDNSRKALCEFN